MSFWTESKPQSLEWSLLTDLLYQGAEGEDAKRQIRVERVFTTNSAVDFNWSDLMSSSHFNNAASINGNDKIVFTTAPTWCLEEPCDQWNPLPCVLQDCPMCTSMRGFQMGGLVIHDDQAQRQFVGEAKQVLDHIRATRDDLGSCHRFGITLGIAKTQQQYYNHAGAANYMEPPKIDDVGMPTLAQPESLISIETNGNDSPYGANAPAETDGLITDEQTRDTAQLSAENNLPPNNTLMPGSLPTNQVQETQTMGGFNQTIIQIIGAIIVTVSIKFYNIGEPYYEFTNFYPSNFMMGNKSYDTNEHYFQSQKFSHNRQIAHEVRTAPSPRAAFNLARKYATFARPDWHNGARLTTMYEGLCAKFRSSSHLRHLLLSTKDLLLIEHTENDNYWGDAGDGTGQNMLGKLLMRVRKEIADEDEQEEPLQKQQQQRGPAGNMFASLGLGGWNRKSK